MEDLKQSLDNITASKIDDQWPISPIKKSVEKIIQKLDLEVMADEITALMAGGMSSEELHT